MKNSASALWKGSGPDGSGTIHSNSGILKNAPFSFRSRTAASKDTTPEELIAAAHASCFAMKLAFSLGALGFVPAVLETSCELTFEAGVITTSKLSVKAKVKGISDSEFQEVVNDARTNCPVTQLMRAPVSIVSMILD